MTAQANGSWPGEDVFVAGFHTYLLEAEHSLIKWLQDIKEAENFERDDRTESEGSGESTYDDFEKDPRMTPPARA